MKTIGHLGRYGILTLILASEGPIWGKAVGERSAARIFAMEAPEWVPGPLARPPWTEQTPVTYNDRLTYIIGVLVDKKLLKKKWVQSKPTSTLSWTITDKGRRWLKRAEQRGRGLGTAMRHADDMKWRKTEVDGRRRYYSPGMLDFGWQGIIEVIGRGWQWQLTMPDGLCSSWKRSEMLDLQSVKAEVEATFRKYAITEGASDG